MRAAACCLFLSLPVCLLSCTHKPETPAPQTPATPPVAVPVSYTDTFSGHTNWYRDLAFIPEQAEFDERLYVRREDSVLTIWSDHLYPIPAGNDTMRHFWAYSFPFDSSGKYTFYGNYGPYQFTLTKDSLFGNFFWRSGVAYESLFFLGRKQ